MNGASFITFAQASRLLGCDPRTLARITSQNNIQVVRVSRSRRKVNAAQLQAWLDSGGLQERGNDNRS